MTDSDQIETQSGVNTVPLCAVGECVSKHRGSALGLFLGSLVLNDVPVLKQDSVFHTAAIQLTGSPKPERAAAMQAPVPSSH